MSPATLEEIELDLLLIAEMDEKPACQDIKHPHGWSHHDPDQRASFLMINPCHGDRALICYSRAYYLWNEAADIECGACGKKWPYTAYRFIPIADDVPPL